MLKLMTGCSYCAREFNQNELNCFGMGWDNNFKATTMTDIKDRRIMYCIWLCDDCLHKTGKPLEVNIKEDQKEIDLDKVKGRELVKEYVDKFIVNCSTKFILYSNREEKPDCGLVMANLRFMQDMENIWGTVLNK